MRMSLRRFVKGAWKQVEPAPLVWNWHLDALCDHLSYVTLGEIRFLMTNVIPRATKSLTTSVFWPVWGWLHDPTLQYLTASYALQLSTRDCLRSRQLIDSVWFQQRYGSEFRFSFDDKLKRQYSNDKGGRRIALSVDGATTGEGGDIIVVDDPHNATEIESEAIRQRTHDWWDNAMSSRFNQPDHSAWVLLGQRTGEDDLFGHVLKRERDNKEIVHLVLPNEYIPKRHCTTRLPASKKVIFSDPRTTEGELMYPQRLSAKATARLKRVMPKKYGLQYQQDTKTTGGNILERSKWRPWTAAQPPECSHILTVWDTAYGEKQENDYSARTDWGIFPHSELVRNPETGETVKSKTRNCIMLLGAYRKQMPYHELKRQARNHYRKLKPDHTLVENKGSGISLAQDLSRAGVRGLRRISLSHGGRVKLDKVERAHIASTVLDDGLVYYPERQWAEDVIDECAAFPNGTHDDWVDTCLMAWQFLRRMGEVHLWEEEEADGTVRLFKRKPGVSLYG